MQPRIPADFMTRDELEEALGAPSEYIYAPNDLANLRAWARSIGHAEPEVAVMSPVALANLYHAEGGKKTDPVALHKMFLDILEAVSVPGFNVDLTRMLAREEMRDEFTNWQAAAAKAVADAIAAMPPRIIQIVSQTAPAVTLPGPMHYKTEETIRIAALAHPIMLVGPAGCGKTTIGQHVAAALQLPFYITSTINDTHELTGFVDGYGKYHSTPFRRAFEHGGVWVADEIDAWDASALLAANAALANGYAVFPDRDEPIMRNSGFRIVATANTYGNGADRVYIGRNELDAASLDRFAMITVDYDLTLEQIMSGGNHRWLEHVWEIRKAVMEKQVRHVVGTRAIIYGSAALASGIAWDRCEEIYIYKGMSESDRRKIS